MVRKFKYKKILLFLFNLKIKKLQLSVGVAWLSSARVVKCSVNSFNGRNPCFLLMFRKTANEILEKDGDHVKSSWPLRIGLYTCYNGIYKEKL